MPVKCDPATSISSQDQELSDVNAALTVCQSDLQDTTEKVKACDDRCDGLKEQRHQLRVCEDMRESERENFELAFPADCMGWCDDTCKQCEKAMVSIKESLLEAETYEDQATGLLLSEFMIWVGFILLASGWALRSKGW